MGINNLRLSPELIATLYPDTLISENDRPGVKLPEEKPVPGPKTAAYPFLGKNIRSICILVHYHEADFIPDEPFAFLIKMLSACKCSIDDVAIVNAARNQVNLHNLKSQFQPVILFLWGVLPAIIPGTGGLPDMNISILDGISVVPVRFADIMSKHGDAGLDLKKQLWTCLIKLFNL
jgi:hypothetical protein